MSIIAVLIIKYAVRAVLLTLLLWGMIQVQKLNYSKLGLLGSAALASGLDMIPHFGHYLAVPVLYLCIWKVTGASLMPDAIFTVVVAYSLMFAVQMLLLTALMPPIHYGHRAVDQSETAPVAVPAKVKPNAAPAPVSRAEPAAVPATEIVAAMKQPPTNPALPVSSKNAEAWLKNVKVKGSTENGDKSMLLISSNKKNYTLMAGEPILIQTENGPCHLRLMQVSEPWAIVEVNGETAYLRIH
jgi:hypothetical protein